MISNTYSFHFQTGRLFKNNITPRFVEAKKVNHTLHFYDWILEIGYKPSLIKALERKEVIAKILNQKHQDDLFEYATNLRNSCINLKTPAEDQKVVMKRVETPQKEAVYYTKDDIQMIKNHPDLNFFKAILVKVKAPDSARKTILKFFADELVKNPEQSLHQIFADCIQTEPHLANDLTKLKNIWMEMKSKKILAKGFRAFVEKKDPLGAVNLEQILLKQGILTDSINSIFKIIAKNMDEQNCNSVTDVLGYYIEKHQDDPKTKKMAEGLKNVQAELEKYMAAHRTDLNSPRQKNLAQRIFDAPSDILNHIAKKTKKVLGSAMQIPQLVTT